MTNIGAATTFYYDADGNRVGPGGTTFYIGDHSELIPGVKWTQYYTFNGQRVAVRDGGGGPVSWLQGDNLGSASMTTDANGNKTSEYRYTPFGGVRVAWGSLPTNRRFIPQFTALARDVPPAMRAKMRLAASTLRRLGLYNLSRLWAALSLAFSKAFNPATGTSSLRS